MTRKRGSLDVYLSVKRAMTRTVTTMLTPAANADARSPRSWRTVRFQYEMDNRAVSEDGSRIVFTTAEPLSPAASNGLVNVYEWHEAPGGGEGACR